MKLLQAHSVTALPYRAAPPAKPANRTGARLGVRRSAYLVVVASLFLTACAASQHPIQPLPELDRKTKPAPTPAEQKSAIDSVLAKGAQHKSETLKRIEGQK
jgi:hypothetical protein